MESVDLSNGHEAEKDLVALIGGCELKNVVTGEMVKIEEFFQSTCVLIFFRRWGCLLGRVWANELTEMSNILKRHDIRLIGIGLEELGAQEYAAGHYFDGELYVDVNKKVYETLQFKRFTYYTMMKALLTTESRAVIARGRQLALGGNLRGDGLQNGGALIVEKGGKLLMEFKQDGPAEHVTNEKILTVLGLDSEIVNLPKKNPEGNA